MKYNSEIELIKLTSTLKSDLYTIDKQTNLPVVYMILKFIN